MADNAESVILRPRSNHWTLVLLFVA